MAAGRISSVTTISSRIQAFPKKTSTGFAKPSSPRSIAAASSTSLTARANVTGRVVIVVDDGIATGATTRAALEAIREQRPKWLVLAVPVAPTSTLDELSGLPDEIVCLQSHEPFYAIGLYYDDFRQVSDREVIDILSNARKPETTISRG